MTNQVYYRKWRPSSFAELVGQEHIATTLRQSVKQGRVSHSYLFCGPRGSGKTTTARIIAKAVNCLDLQDGDPCNTCVNCVQFNEGRFMDIIELDAASNRGIDEIRDIREKVNFAPVQGGRKVYIIDEAHMLTDAASNAFLKTLEEPPAHVIFVLCTTESHKILATIVSRCQRFDFRRIPSDLIYQRLSEIVDAEGDTVEPEALRLISRYAAGSLRDAQNLLEQLTVSYGDGVALHHVEDMLGVGHGDQWLELVKYLLMGNTSASLAAVNQASWGGTDLRQLHRQTLELLRAVLLIQWSSDQTLDIPEHVASQLQELVTHLPSWRVVKAVKRWGEVNMRYDFPSTLPLELAVVEICEDQGQTVPVAAAQTAQPTTQSIPQAKPAARENPAKAPPVPTAPAVTPPVTESEPADSPTEISKPAPAMAEQSISEQSGNDTPDWAEAPSSDPASVPISDPAPVPGEVEPAPSTASEYAAPWAATVKTLSRHKGKKYNLGALLRGCKAESISLDANTLVLPFTHMTNMERMQEEMDDPTARGLVTQVISECFGQSYDLKITLAEGNGSSGANPKASQTSPLVRAAMGMGARILEEVPE
ncbi:MAG TPA: DNA polymerase III subunit gamma/tau [Dehalococcoidia bacterium]|nr:DNA polymerase III subunit gamma/tau [Dehalococcoidia bacterium]